MDSSICILEKVIYIVIPSDGIVLSPMALVSLILDKVISSVILIALILDMVVSPKVPIDPSIIHTKGASPPSSLNYSNLVIDFSFIVVQCRKKCTHEKASIFS